MILSTFDWVVLGILGCSSLISLRRGFVREALSLTTWIAAVFIARFFAREFAFLLQPYIENEFFRLGVSFLSLFLATLLVGGMLNHLVSEFVRVTGLGGLDRLLGTVFGFARGCIVVLVVVAVIHYLLPFENDEWYQKSKFMPELVSFIEQFGPSVWEKGEELFDRNRETLSEDGVESLPTFQNELLGS